MHEVRTEGSAPTTYASGGHEQLKLVSGSTFDWQKVGRELSARFQRAPIRLIPASNSPTIEDIEKEFPEARRIFAVDFYLRGAEKGELLSCGSGYRIGRILNIDHHAPDERWEQHVSSGVLACRWVRANGIVRPEDGDVVVINHTDCDSVLAALILTGVLPPDERFEEAVLDADHRGMPNELSDILQACSSLRDLPRMIEALSCFFQGNELPSYVQQQLELLYEKRSVVEDMVSQLKYEEQDGVVFIKCDRYLDGDLFLRYFPNAQVLVISCPSDKYPELTLTRLRLGAGVESGLSLHRLRVTENDRYFGGRFNAGSNKRGLEAAVDNGAMPVVVSPREHFERLARLLAQERPAIAPRPL